MQIFLPPIGSRQKKIRNVALAREEYTAFGTIAGRVAKQRLDHIVRDAATTLMGSGSVSRRRSGREHASVAAAGEIIERRLQHAQFLAHLDKIAVGLGPEGRDIGLDLLQDPGCSVCGCHSFYPSWGADHGRRSGRQGEGGLRNNFEALNSDCAIAR
jgi:hypothetical protein